jgi:hypothetical protein
LLHALRERWLANETYGEVRSFCARILESLPAGSHAWLEAAAPLGIALLENAEYEVFAGLLAGVQEALAKGVTAPDAGTVGCLEYVCSVLDAHRGDRAAIARLRRVADEAAAAGNRKLEEIAQSNLAVMFAQQGDIVAARAILATRAAISPSTAGAAVFERAKILVTAFGGDLAAAKQRAETALARRGNITLLTLTGVVAFYLADVPLLARIAARIEALVGPGAFPGPLVRGQLLLLHDELAAGAEAFVKATDQALYPNQRLACSVFRAQALLALGDVAGAAEILGAIERQQGGKARGSAALPSAHLDRVRGEWSQADAKARAALAKEASRGCLLLATDALELLALLAADRGALDDAARLVGATSAFRAHAQYRWQPHHVRGDLARVLPQLDPESVRRGGALTVLEAAATL